MEDKENIEIISGDGSTLDISPVYEHIKPEKPDTHNKPKNIVIPIEKKSDDSNKSDETNN